MVSTQPEQLISKVLILFSDIPDCLSISGKAKPLPQECSRYVCLEIASTWLKNCIEGHAACAILDPGFMPNRLIYVGQDNTDLFLADGEIEAAPYAALSYCWGNVRSPFVTTRENIDEHRKRIPFALLPSVRAQIISSAASELSG